VIHLRLPDVETFIDPFDEGLQVADAAEDAFHQEIIAIVDLVDRVDGFLPEQEIEDVRALRLVDAQDDIRLAGEAEIAEVHQRGIFLDDAMILSLQLVMERGDRDSRLPAQLGQGLPAVLAQMRKDQQLFFR